jgi:hypothetical protein
MQLIDRIDISGRAGRTVEQLAVVHRRTGGAGQSS